uniref:Uncharacterized protein n=1 Tax=Mycena chlorophos TaxID=658473 RepID=A0ABQ0LY41_MYCCL|nr:predicted protein [Mycena chlorophos]
MRKNTARHDSETQPTHESTNLGRRRPAFGDDSDLIKVSWRTSRNGKAARDPWSRSGTPAHVVGDKSRRRTDAEEPIRLGTTVGDYKASRVMTRHGDSSASTLVRTTLRHDLSLYIARFYAATEQERVGVDTRARGTGGGRSAWIEGRSWRTRLELEHRNGGGVLLVVADAGLEKSSASGVDEQAKVC